MSLDHPALVTRAERWLRNTLHCRAVQTEPRALTHSCEQPDAIGWVNGRCIIVECKISRSDFYADLKKVARNPLIDSLGDWRFYLTPPGLLDGINLPDGWGWYTVNGRTVRHAGGESYTNMKTPPCRSRRDSEIAILLYALDKAGSTACPQ
jgi:hypothetical protein